MSVYDENKQNEGAESHDFVIKQYRFFLKIIKAALDKGIPCDVNNFFGTKTAMFDEFNFTNGKNKYNRVKIYTTETSVPVNLGERTINQVIEGMRELLPGEEILDPNYIKKVLPNGDSVTTINVSYSVNSTEYLDGRLPYGKLAKLEGLDISNTFNIIRRGNKYTLEFYETVYPKDALANTPPILQKTITLDDFNLDELSQIQ